MQKQFLKVGLKKMTPRIIGNKFQIESNHKKDKKVKKKIEIWEVNSFIHSLSLSWARYLHPLVSLSLSKMIYYNYFWNKWPRFSS